MIVSKTEFILNASVQPKDGRLYLKYTLDLNSSFLSDNEIIMTMQNQ